MLFLLSIAINSFGFGGSNGHMLLAPNGKDKKKIFSDNLFRLVCVSSRTVEGVALHLNKIKENAFDLELMALIQQIYK